MGRAVVFISGKGGTGKTSAVAAIGSYLVLMGKRVICVDADPLGGLDVAVGMGGQTLYNLADAADGLCRPGEALSEFIGVPPEYETGADSYRFAKLGGEESISETVFGAIIDNLKKRCDWLLIDAPAGLKADYPADVSVYVVNADSVNYRAASRVRDDDGTRDTLMIINRVQEKLLRRFKATLDDAIDGVGVRLLGYVPEDSTVKVAMMKGCPLAFYKRHSDESPAQKSFKEIAGRLVRFFNESDKIENAKSQLIAVAEVIRSPETSKLGYIKKFRKKHSKKSLE